MATSVLGNYFECKPVLVEDADIVLCASGSVVLGIDLQNGDLKFSFKGHSDVVTCICFNALQSSRVISCSRDGDVITWDLNTRVVISRFAVDKPVHAVIVPAFTNHEVTGKPDIFLVLERNNDEIDKEDAADSSADKRKSRVIRSEDRNLAGKRFKLVVYDSFSSKNRRNICRVSGHSNTITLANVDGSEIIVAVSKRNLCLVFADNRLGMKSTSSINFNMTCATSNSNRDIIVTGHLNGMMLIWHDIKSWVAAGRERSITAGVKSELVSISPPACTILHWHSHPVASIATNNDGTMIYSGGEEGVVVVWQTSTGIKNFIPHLGSNIAHITASSSAPIAVVTTTNNCLRVLSTTSLLERWMTQSMCVGPFLDYSIPSDIKSSCQIQVDPISDFVVCNGYPGQLQMYDISANSVKFIHDVVQFNRVSRTDQYTKLYVPTVSLFKFHKYQASDGHKERIVMATVDTRRGEEFARELNLKFWEWSEDNQTYRLVTHVPRPHGENRISSLAFNPANSASCVSAAMDGSVKMWRSTSSSVSPHWVCMYSLTYRYLNYF
jgi:NET1-associated nuclear protein 1 (U3 small nucleolar RNA-associated protein 17)